MAAYRISPQEHGHNNKCSNGAKDTGAACSDRAGVNNTPGVMRIESSINRTGTGHHRRTRNARNSAGAMDNRSTAHRRRYGAGTVFGIAQGKPKNRRKERTEEPQTPVGCNKGKGTRNGKTRNAVQLLCIAPRAVRFCTVSPLLNTFIFYY